jgi:hypothetical protein
MKLHKMFYKSDTIPVLVGSIVCEERGLKGQKIYKMHDGPHSSTAQGELTS